MSKAIKEKDPKLTKTKSNHNINFKYDKDDNHFTYIVVVENKSGKEVKRTMIVSKDRDDFLKRYLEDGWVIAQ